MTSRLIVAAVIVLLLGSVTAFGQEASTIRVARITDNIYELTETYPFETNLTASVGPDGILLVDAGSKYSTEELKRVLKTLGAGEVRYIINTHAHGEHTTGNKAFGKEVIKIGQANLRPRLQTRNYVLEEFSEEALPSITFTDSMSLYFNGEQIRLIALPGAHDDADIIVHFTKSKVVSTGALSTGFRFPTVDGRGGNALLFPDRVQRLIELVPADVTLIPGHGRNTTIAEEKQFHDMLVQTIDIVKAGLAAGKDAEALKQEKVLQNWVSYEGGAATADGWIQSISNAVNKVSPKEPAAVAMYHMLKEKDADAAVAKWYELKKDSQAVYSVTEGQLVAIGYYLMQKNRTADATRIFELYVKEFPDAWNAYDCLGEAYMKAGDKELARKNYNKSLELNPQNTNAVDMLKRL